VVYCRASEEDGGGGGFFSGCYSTKPPTMQNFVAIGWKIPEISAIENLCSPKKVGQSSPKIFKGCYPSIMPNFIKIGQTSLEIGVGRKKNFHTQTDTYTHRHRHTASWLVESRLAACETSCCLMASAEETELNVHKHSNEPNIYKRNKPKLRSQKAKYTIPMNIMVTVRTAAIHIIMHNCHTQSCTDSLPS